MKNSQRPAIPRRAIGAEYEYSGYVKRSQSARI
jgi:hypothetical protein